MFDKYYKQIKELASFNKEENDSGYIIKLDDGKNIKSKTIIYAAGAYPRRADVPGEEEYTGKGVSYCAICDGAFYKDKTVTVLGGGDTALDDALYLSDICKKVYLIHRRNEFRGAQSTVEKLKEKDNVEFVLSDSVVEIKGDKKLDSVKLASGKELAVDGIFIAYGSVPQTALVKDIVQLESKVIEKIDEGMQMISGTIAAEKKASPIDFEHLLLEMYEDIELILKLLPYSKDYRNPDKSEKTSEILRLVEAKSMFRKYTEKKAETILNKKRKGEN